MAARGMVRSEAAEWVFPMEDAGIVQAGTSVGGFLRIPVHATALNELRSQTGLLCRGDLPLLGRDEQLRSPSDRTRDMERIHRTHGAGLQNGHACRDDIGREIDDHGLVARC
jgi:hypothetical protein